MFSAPKFFAMDLLPSQTSTILVSLALAVHITYELHYFAKDVLIPSYHRFAKFLGRLSIIFQDFRSAKFYKPWSSAKHIVIVSEKKHIVELSESSSLSQRAVYADMFGFKHTMNGFAHDGVKTARTRLYSRMLQVRGPENLAGMFACLREHMVLAVQEELKGCSESQESFSLPAAKLFRNTAARMMSVAMFGEELTEEKPFFEALSQYPKDMVRSMMVFMVTPSTISTWIHSVVTRNGRAMHSIQDRLKDIIGPGRQLTSWAESERIRKHTVLYNFTEMAKENDYWTSELISQSLLGIWFAASHQPWMNLTTVVFEVCRRPAWQRYLREELGDYMKLDYDELESLPLLDSFIKETIRLNHMDQLGIRRKALQDFRFSEGGPRVPAGSIACVSSYGLMHDSVQYANPDHFDGARFANSDSGSGRKFTAVSEKYPLWGYGSLACPGRFHAALIMKLILAFFITNFDMSLQDPSCRTGYIWETFSLHYESTKIVLKPRDRKATQSGQESTSNGS